MKRTADVDIMVGPLQARVMHYLWLSEHATVQQVMTALNEVNYQAKVRPLAYTTYLTILRNLAIRGFITQVKQQRSTTISDPREDYALRAHLFTPKISKVEFKARMAKHVLDTYFEGDAASFIGALPVAVVP